MRRTTRAAVLTAALVTLTPLVASATGSTDATAASTTSTDSTTDSRLQPWLADQLLTAAPADLLRVMVSGESTEAAQAAVAAAGLRVQQVWSSTAIVVAVGTPDAVRAVAAQPGVTYVEGEQPIDLTLSSAHTATRSKEALATFTTASGARVDGAGVSIAVIDSGIDGTHPMFQRDGRTTVVRNLKNACTVLTAATDTCFQQDPTNDTDTNAVGGHGTHVAGIAGGVEVTTTEGTQLRGSAPGASLVGLSVGGGLSIINANAAMQWVVDHQAQPCKPAGQQTGTPDPACPPIRVTNHSYGPAASSGGNRFDPNSATVRIQRALVAKGVVPVWAAGNDGGDGTSAFTNPPAMDPTGGVVMVGSYNDAGTGTRDHQMSTFSSRGNATDVSTFPDVSAPGDRITSACRPYLAICSTGLDPQDGPALTDVGTFNTISGTSMAAPYVAGVVAQLVQAAPALTPAQVEDALEDTAYEFTAGAPYVADLADRNADDTTSFDKGHGLVDVVEAVQDVTAVAAPAPSPSPSPTKRTGKPVK